MGMLLTRHYKKAQEEAQENKEKAQEEVKVKKTRAKK